MGRLAIADTSGLQTALDAKAPLASPTFTGTVALPNDQISYAEMQNVAALSVVGNATNATADPAEITAGSDGQVLRRSGTALGFGTIATAGIADAQVTYAKIQNVAGLSVVARSANTSGVGADVTAGSDGDVLRRSGTTLGFGAIPQASVTSLTADLALKAPLASPTFTTALTAANPTFTGTVTIPDGALAIADTSGLQSALDLKAPLASPTFTGTVALPNDQISYAEMQNVAALSVVGNGTNAIADPADITAGTDGHVLRRSGTTLGFGTIPQASIINLTTDLGLKAPLASPTFTTALTAANPTFTGTITIPDGALAIADTSGLQTALDGKQPLDADLTALAAAGNSAVLAATTASFLTADETKLDGIETLADVTDATNVAAAGAVMTTGAQLVSAKANNDLTANPKFWVGTQAEYNLLTPTAGELYLILA